MREAQAPTERERVTLICYVLVVAAVRSFAPAWSRLPGRGCGVEAEVEVMVIAVVASK